jgi:fatty-acyl-CoA synthase
MIAELLRRLGASRRLPGARPLGAALERAGLDPATVIGALRLVALGRIRPVRPTVLVRLALDFLRRGGRGPQRLLELHARNTPGHLALCSDGADPLRLGYRALHERVVALSWGLWGLGVRPGDRVAMMLHNGAAPIEVAAALGWLGASGVLVGWRLKPREVGYLLADSGARALVFEARERAVIEEALVEARQRGGRLDEAACVEVGGDPGSGRFVAYAHLLEERDHDGPPRPAGGGSGGLLTYTSGTTGPPKGASRDFAAMGLGPVLNFIADLPLDCDERHLLVCPLYHSSGAFFSQLVLGLGGTLFIHDHFDAAAVLDAIAGEGITSVALVPTMLRRLLALGPAALAARDLSSLRWVISVAAPLPTALADRAERALGPILYNFYAATETGVVTVARPGEHTARPGTIGRAVIGADIRLLDGRGAEVPVGEVGEIYVRSAMLIGGYHGRPEATAAARQGGYFSVGDLGRVDADGYYYLVDRKSDVVISGGVNIYPYEIEQRLHEHPAVADCAVVGYPDEEWGESLAAFVVLRPGAAAAGPELAAFVGEGLADFKRPRRVLFDADLPRNPTGKVDKRALRARLTAPVV